MPSVYDDPDFAEDDDYNVQLERQGDGVRGQIIRVMKQNTTFGPRLKYVLFDLDRNTERSMLAGPKNLKGQMMELKPEAGDVITVTLTELRDTGQGNPAKLFDVSVERMQRPGPPPNGPAPVPQAPQAPPVAPARAEPPTQLRAPAPSPVAVPQAPPTAPAWTPPDDDDLFGG